MPIGTTLVNSAWIIAVLALVFFLYVSHPRQRAAVLLALAFPGLGHLFIKRTRRGLFFMSVLVALFLAGMILADFRNISPFDRHPIWGLAQMPGGLMTLVAALATGSLKIMGENAFYSIGCLYSSAACLLNLLAACDVWDLTENEEQRKKREARTA